jgi:hypothetical protein
MERYELLTSDAVQGFTKPHPKLMPQAKKKLGALGGQEVGLLGADQGGN